MAPFMRHLIIAIFVFVLAAGTNAESLSDYQVIRSKPTDDLILEIWLPKTNVVIPSSFSVRYDWLTSTNNQMKVYMLKDEYFCYAQMFDSSGNAMLLRSSFTNLGKQFFELTYPSNEQPSSEIENLIRAKPAHVKQQSAKVEFVIATQDVGGGAFFYNIEDVFQMQKSGQYKVRLQFQVYERIYKGGQNFTYKLVRFDPVEFNVTKE
jgi:hypothetical protein